MFGNEGSLIQHGQNIPSDFDPASIGFLVTIWDYPPSGYLLSLSDDPHVITGFSEEPIPPTGFVTTSQAKKQATYEATNWQFGSVWAIKEGISYPTILAQGQHAIPGLPGESIRSYVFVEPAPDGSMFYDGEIYKSLRMNNTISKFVGEPGEVVAHTWGGNRQRASDGQTYVFLASGVQDPDFPGGYGAYAPDTERTVTLRADRSINVNFYYILAGLPEYNYLMRISVPGGGFHIAVLKEDVSAIKLKMPDGSICTVDIVTLEDEMASDIRVALPTGIFALKKVVLSG